ncbi:translation initiation factor IF-3 [Rickettsiales endosymbiont of Stachyamoeba lipophora]|uniref:translation initiation factor IF-3 n=1 Tax=Rickettsiales endosymbiont of Stachyamoeba lipophora TaxID=2486578 RepID=UPI000F64AA60|nr:translation initiation factor IF-3 [Rickettsiales endosymbiont of Stachyamoeba lipophora]AZL15317.1 translation initiation factor IF-3 [Rickettsiales endosymbiont of Stachyamoeba lipophora]
MTKSKNNLPRANREINVKEVRLVGAEGQMLGVVPLREALNLAEQAGLDLVEVSPNAEPPVCKIIDFGKYKYELQKKAHEAKKKQTKVEIKEIKLRPNIGQGDLDIKTKAIIKFLNEGNKVKVSLRFRGREITHQELGRNVFEKIKESIQEVGKIELDPKMEGMQLVMILTPAKTLLL